jgi:hypothetical protein
LAVSAWESRTPPDLNPNGAFGNYAEGPVFLLGRAILPLNLRFGAAKLLKQRFGRIAAPRERVENPPREVF